MFRRELDDLQDKLLRYTKMLGDMAGVEDLTELENGEPSVRQFQERADFAHHVDSPTPPAEPAKALRKLEGGAHQERLQPEQPHRGRGGRRDDLDNAQIATNDPSSS